MAVKKEDKRWHSAVRRLQHVKGVPNKIGNGAPSPSEGKDGDTQVRMTQTGVAIYAKLQGKWSKFSSDSEPTAAGPEIIASDGYMTFSNGLIMQWGIAGDPDVDGYFGTTHAMTWTKPFPNNVFSVNATWVIKPDDVDGANQAPGINWSSLDLTGATWSTPTDYNAFYWIALGN